MAQHDYIIANQGFPSFRSDLNNALSATVTNNSGTSEPTTKYSGQIFADTNTSGNVIPYKYLVELINFLNIIVSDREM